MNHPHATLYLKNLRLDLRGLPRETAESVPTHLAAALRGAFSGNPPSVSGGDGGASRIHLKIDPGMSALAVAAVIATATAQRLGSSIESQSQAKG